MGACLCLPVGVSRHGQTPALRPLQSRSQSRLRLTRNRRSRTLSRSHRSQTLSRTMMTTTIMMTSATMTTGSMTMTDKENIPAQALIRALNAKLRDEIMRDIAELPQADLRGVLRMIAVWKGRGNE